MATGIIQCDPLGMRYKTTDTPTLSDIVMYGYMVGNRQRMYLTVFTPKSLKDITTVTVTGMQGMLRGVDGTIDSTNTYSELTSLYDSVECDAFGENYVRIKITTATTFSTVQGNSPVIYSGSLSLSFT